MNKPLLSAYGIGNNFKVLVFTEDKDKWKNGTFLLGTAEQESDWDNTTKPSITITLGATEYDYKIVDTGVISDKVIYLYEAFGNNAGMKLYISNDNVNWTEIANFTGQSSAVVSLFRYTFRYIKITLYSPSSATTDGTPSLYSISVFDLNDYYDIILEDDGSHVCKNLKVIDYVGKICIVIVSDSDAQVKLIRHLLDSTSTISTYEVIQ